MRKLYLRSDFLEMIEPWLWGRELWFGQGSPRPLKSNSAEEFRSLVSNLKLNDPFPFFLSIECFSSPLALTENDPGRLRISWDFLLDLDAEDFDAARRAAYKAKQVLEKFNVENYLLKFSGRRGFHLIIPSLSLDIFQPGESRLAYPKLAVMLAKFFEAVICEPEVKIDLSVYKPRQLMRAPYSYHEKTGLLSIPVDDPLDFRMEEAKPENAEIQQFYARSRPGECRKLLEAVREWFKSQDRNEPGLKILSYGKVKEGSKKGYGWIERLLEKPVDDGRHRLLWLVIAPYLVNVKGFPIDEAIRQAYNYLLKCSEIRPIREDLRKLAEYYVNYAARTGLKPVSLQTLKTRNEYSELWKILKPILFISG